MTADRDTWSHDDRCPKCLPPHPWHGVKCAGKTNGGLPCQCETSREVGA